MHHTEKKYMHTFFTEYLNECYQRQNLKDVQPARRSWWQSTRCNWKSLVETFATRSTIASSGKQSVSSRRNFILMCNRRFVSRKDTLYFQSWESLDHSVQLTDFRSVQRSTNIFSCPSIRLAMGQQVIGGVKYVHLYQGRLRMYHTWRLPRVITQRMLIGLDTNWWNNKPH